MTQKVSKSSVKASLLKFRRLVLALVFLFAAQGVWGETYTWTGDYSTDWNNEDNWEDSFGTSALNYPNSTDDVVTIPSGCSDYPVITNGKSFSVKSLSIETGASLIINSNGTLTVEDTPTINGSLTVNGTFEINDDFIIVSNIQNSSSGTISVSGKLTNNTSISRSSLALQCQTLEVSANLECKSLSVSSTSSLTNTNASGVTYLVATGDDGISFGGNVTANSAGTPVNGAQFVLGGNVTATSPINLNVASGMLNHVEENTNNHKNWSSNITTVLMNDGCTFGMQDGQSYKTTIEATSGDVYFVGNGTISSIDDSASNAACKLHFGDTESSQNNTFTFGNGITFSKITDIVLDASCKGLKGAVTLSGIKNFSNLSSKLSASSDKIVPTILLAAGATISGNNVNFSTVTCAGAVTIQPDTGKSFSFDSLTCNGNTTISGNNTITDFTASGLGGSNLTIDGTQTITNAAISGNNTNKLSVKGSGSLKLSNPLIANYLDFPESTGPSVTQKPAYASNSTATGGNIPTGWVVVDADQHVWNGSTNAWETATNWLPQSVPQSTDDVIINAGTPYPLISSDVTVKSITKDSNATITVATGSSLTIADASEFDEKITGQGTGKYIVGSGKTYTVTSDKTLNINIENNGTINVSASLSATSFSGTGTINLNGTGGDTALTATSSTVTSEQNSIVLINTNATLSGKYSLGSFSATNANNMSGKSITFSGAPTITAGNISLSGANSSPLVLNGNGTIIKANTGTFTAGYLSIGENVLLSNYSNAISNCVPTADNSDPENWLAVIHNGWNIKNLNTFTYEWSGASSTAWNNTANWNTGFVPQTDCKIVIPSGKARYPVVSEDQNYEGGTLAIAAGATITFGSKNLTLSGTDYSGDSPANPILSNEGTIIFTGNGRIKNSTTAINDTANGTVQYSGTGSGVVTDFDTGTGADYNNLKILGTGWSISGSIKAADIEANSLTLSGDTTLETTTSCTLKGTVSDSGTSDLIINSAATIQCTSITTGGDQIYNEAVSFAPTGKATALNASSIYFKNNVTTTNTTTVTVDAELFIGTAGSGISITTPLVAKDDITFNGANTLTQLTGTNLTGKTITFESGKKQTITTLNLSGTSGDGNKLTLEGTGEWELDCTTYDINYVDVKNSKATNTIYALNSKDSAGNTNWIFPGMTYTWKGGKSGAENSWNEKENWNEGAVPCLGAVVIIPAVTNHPVLAADLSLKTSYKGTAYNGSITINENAGFDIAEYALELGTITNNGLLRTKGVTGKSITGTMSNGTTGTSTVEYYDDNIENLFWNGGTPKYKNLILNGETSSATAISVAGTTTIKAGTGKTVSLTSTSNTFTGAITLGTASTTSAGGVTLKAAGTITIADAAYADELNLTASTINLQNVETITGGQSYTGAVVLQGATELKAPSAQTISFVNGITGAYKLTTTDASATFGGNINIGELETAAANINCATVTTTGAQTYNGVINLGVSPKLTAKEGTTLKNITLNNSVTASGDYSITFDSNAITALSSGMSIGVPVTVNGNLSNTGITTFNGKVIAKGELLNTGSATFNADVEASANVTDTGSWSFDTGKKLVFNGTTDQTFNTGSSTYLEVIENKTNGNLEISGDCSITTFSITKGKTTTFTGTPVIENFIDSTNAGNVVFTAGATITNGAALSTTGTVTVTGNIATTNAVFSATKLEVEGDATISTGTGTQSYGTINGKSGTETLELNGSSIAISGNIGGTKKLSSITINGASVLNGSSITTDTVTLKGGNVTGNSTTINGDLIIGTHASGINVSIPLIAKSNVSFYGNNTLTSFTADFSTLTNTTLNKSIIFEKGTLQTFSGKLTLKGIKNEEDYRLVLKSSDEGNTWNIKCESENNHDIKYVEVKDSVNTSSYNLVDYNLVAFESIDFGNNTNWSFPDMFYEWTGADSSNPTLWTEKENWNPKIVPAKGSTIKIKAGKPNYPVLVENLDIYDSYGTDEYGSLIIEENAEFDISNKNLTVFEIRNEGRFRLQGTSTQVITGTMYNGPATPPDAADNSVVEYYGGNTAKLLWDGKSTVDGMQYTNLEITGATNVSEKASVTGTTTINAGTGKTVSLTNTSNVFTGVITLGTASTTSAGNVTLKAADPVTIANNAYADSVSVICPSITIQKVTTNGSSTGTQYYEGAVTAVTGSGIEIVNTGLCTFVGTVAADSLSISGDASITGTVTTTDGTQTYSGALSGGNMQLIADTVTLKDSLTNSGTVQITADTFIDNSSSANLGESAGGTTSVSITGNLIIHNGTITVNTDVSASEDIIILGTNYSEIDGTTGIANEYAYNCNRPESWSEPSYRAALSSIHNAALTVAAGKSIHVGKNFYANGTSLTGSAEWFIDILSNADSQLCFAEAYNSTFSNCTVRKHTGGTSAEEDDANAQIMAEACTIAANCKHFDNTDFEIVETWTTRDNIVYVKFNRAVRNLYGELNLKIANFKYFNAADCDSSYSGFFINADGSTALEDGSEVELVYLKSEDDKNWNTDATGTTPGVANSTDRNGTERTAIPYIDIPRATASASFIVTDRFGKRLKHYSGASRITTVLDKTGPVLVEVRTGQETHETNLANQAAYDAHNFIEFIYSEPVFFGTHTDTINTVGSQNIQVSNALGIVTSTLTSDTDLTFAGIGVTIENGQMQTRKAGVDSDDATMNAMYRDSTHSLKISLAGYAQNVSSNGTITGSYIMWPGYIEQAVLPQGAVSTTATPASPNTVVTDTDNNQQIMQKTDLTVNNSQQTGTNYGPWDTQEPVFVKVHKHGEDTALDYYEALGNGDGSTLNRIEIHVSDNPSSDESFNKYWLTGYGWTTDPSGTLLSSAADNLVGGSRPFDSLAVSNTTTGGLRYCTILNQESAFKYEVGETDSPTQNFTLIEESASAPFFAGASDTRNNIPLAKDNTYISLSLSDTSLPYKTTFTVSYDSTSSYITDLAGNRLKSVSTMKTLDRTSPDFKISFSPVNQNKIFLLFVKQLRNDIVYNGEDIDESFEEIIPYCFELGTISGSTWTTNSGSALQIDTSVPASIISSKSNSYYTAVELTLNQNATMEDIEETYIRLKPAGTVGGHTYGAQSKDPITGLANSYVTFIQDVVGNYMPMYQAHALSDFAANMVKPLYAYNDDIEYREENLTYSLYEPESWAVHDWNKEQQNYGTLLAQKPVTVIADVDTSYFADDSGNLKYTLRMFYSKNPTAGSESDEYNADIHDSLRLWAPDNSNFANNGLFPAYAAVTNQNYDYVDAVPLDTDLSKGVEFNFTETIAQNFTHGSQISFLFGVFDSSGTTQKSICLNPVLTMSGGSASYNVSAQTPLYIIRLKNPGDITSLDLWSFRVKNVAAQRGNVSIMNNVINADNGEKVVIKVDLKQKGNLNVLVMTLDGNIVDYLQRGEAEEGEHFYSWDGTNRRGKTVARGMYFVRVTGPGIDETRKVLVVK